MAALGLVWHSARELKEDGHVVSVSQREEFRTIVIVDDVQLVSMLKIVVVVSSADALIEAIHKRMGNARPVV